MPGASSGSEPLEALEADPGALERGIIIHRVLERFVKAYPGDLPEDALPRLLDLGRTLFEDFSHRPQVKALWWPRFEQIARWVIEQEQARRTPGLEIMTEVEARLELDGLDFRLKARADRLERLQDGQIVVIDYKTGALPKAADVAAGLAPQLPLEAAMVEAGAFRGIEPAACRRAPVLAPEGRRDRRRAATAGRRDPARRARAPGAGRPAPPGRPLRPARDHLSRPAQAPGRLAGRLRPSGATRRMDQLSPAPARRPAPTPEQRRAAEPSASIWVTASAGTGKTRVLADRVMRLLLAGTDPRQILCLTFTKAAAAEMVKRVEEDLSRFAVLPEAELEAELRQLAGRPPTPEERARARTLLAVVLDLPAGLPIMTIHGFCQSLLKRFPLEAGVVPHFDVLDPRSAADLLREAQAEVLASNSVEIQSALGRLAVLLGETTLAEGLAALREDRLRLGRADHGRRRRAADRQDRGRPGPGRGSGRAARSGGRPAAIPRSTGEPFWTPPARLAAGTGKEAARGQIIEDWLTAEVDQRQRTWEGYATVFLTKERKRQADRLDRQQGVRRRPPPLRRRPWSPSRQGSWPGSSARRRRRSPSAPRRCSGSARRC